MNDGLWHWFEFVVGLLLGMWLTLLVLVAVAALGITITLK